MFSPLCSVKPPKALSNPTNMCAGGTLCDAAASGDAGCGCCAALVVWKNLGSLPADPHCVYLEKQPALK